MTQSARRERNQGTRFSGPNNRGRGRRDIPQRYTAVVALLLIAFVAGPAERPVRAQAPAFLVKDINPAPNILSSGAHDFISVGDTTVFVAWTFSTGTELWRTDGTLGGTIVVKDIQPGPTSSDPTDLTAFQGTVLFAADDGAGGRELWATDGTEAGTLPVRDVLPGSAGSEPSDLTVVGGTVFFVADDGASGRELWTSDGTNAGTALVADIRPGPDGSDPRHLVELNGIVMFAADDGIYGGELWSSDGSADGTDLVKDIYIGPSGSHPAGLASVDGLLMFVAEDGVRGTELWRSDGTRGGTELVREIIGGSPAPSNLFSVGPVLFFTVFEGFNVFPRGDPCVFWFTLWASDGTEEGTSALAGGFCMPAIELALTSVGDQVFFSAMDMEGETGVELWKSDGTEAGTSVVKDINPDGDSYPSELTSFLGKLYFLADDGSHGEELWVSDGTEAGTQLLKDVQAGPEGSSPSALAVVGDRLFFGAEEADSGSEPWVSDGTEAHTFLLKNLTSDSGTYGSRPIQLTEFNGKLLFGASSALWTSDGTWGGTTLVADVFLGDSKWIPPVVAGNIAYFGVDELWRTNGREAGTWLVAPDLDWVSLRASRTAVGRTLFFHRITFWDSELWKSNGTPTGTALVRGDVHIRLGDRHLFTGLDDQLLFVDSGGDLWRSDGSEDGTQLVRSVGVGGVSFEHVHDTLFFAAGNDLWKTDGTAAGTLRVRPGMLGGSNPDELRRVGDDLFFSADKGNSGRELWSSNGTDAGTALVADIRPGPNGSDPRHLVELNGIVMFVADDGVHGSELWRSDGTPEGTVLVRDIYPGPSGSSPGALTDANGHLVFWACEPSGGCEVWESDGTAIGTRRVADMTPGPDSTEFWRDCSDPICPYSFTTVGRLVYFSARRFVADSVGTELWAIPVTSLGRCGNTRLDEGEGCDDGNLLAGDGCSSACQIEECGNAVLDWGEECDDGNLLDGDRCSSACRIECGNGVLDPSESCDDGNFSGGDGCSPSCRIEECGNGVLDPNEPCDDGNLAGGDGCSPSCEIEGQCAMAAYWECRTASRALLLLEQKGGGTRDGLVWKLSRGQATSQEEFADPTENTGYLLCLESDDSLVAECVTPTSSRLRWQRVGTRGYRYKDSSASEDGIQTILLKGSDQDRAKVLVKGKGGHLPDPTLPLELPVTVRLVNADTGVCWQSTFEEGDVMKNEVGRFKARVSD